MITIAIIVMLIRLLILMMRQFVLKKLIVTINNFTLLITIYAVFVKKDL